MTLYPEVVWRRNQGDSPAHNFALVVKLGVWDMGQMGGQLLQADL